MSGNDEEDAADLSSGLVANLLSLAKKNPVSPTSSSPRSTPPESPNKKQSTSPPASTFKKQPKASTSSLKKVPKLGTFLSERSKT